MKYRKLGKTDLSVSEVAFGVWSVSTGWWGKKAPQEGIDLLQKALDLGVNLFDTGDTYGDGWGEEILAKAFKKHRREILIATKFGYDFYTNKEREGHRERPQNFDPQFIRHACEQSLKRLETDYIDLYQLHNPKMPTVQRDEVYYTLEQLVKEGKIRYYGAALGPDIGWFEEGDTLMKTRSIRSMQIIYSILEQEPARKFFPIARERNIGLLSRVPHASEVLTDKYRSQAPTFAAGDHRALRRQEWLTQAVQKAAKVEFLTQNHTLRLSQAAIKFCLAEPTISAVLPNITSLEELQEYTAAPTCEDLTQEELEKLFDLYDHSFYLEPQPSSTG